MALVSKSFSDLITFIRASSATRVNASGLIEMVSSNVARIDYDPVTLAAKGLLIEEQRTNLATYSSAVGGTNWNSAMSGTGVAPVIATNSATAPDGTQTASRLQFSLGGGTTTADTSTVTQVQTGTSCRGSFYVKTNDGTTKTIYVRGAIAASIVVDGTWRRYDFDAGTLAGSQFGIGLRGGQGTTNSDTADLLVWGAQLEAGAFATSYIPTTSATVTRAADVASITGTNFSDWFNASEGTFLIQLVPKGLPSSSARYLEASIAGAAIRTPLLYATSAGLAVATVMNASVTQATLSHSGAFAIGSRLKHAAAYKTDDFASVANGGAPQTDASGTIGLPDRLTIGWATSSPADIFNGWIERLTYYPARLSNALLQSLTA